MSLIILAGCRNEEKQAAVPAIDPTDMDLTVSPGENFYLYANGGWMVKHPLTAEYARYGSFDELAENNVVRLNDLFARMTELTPERGTVEQKIVDLYKQGMDSVRLNADGGAPLKKYLDAVYAAPDKPALIRELAQLNKSGFSAFFSTGVDVDLMNNDIQILYMNQCRLGMGEKDYYMNPAKAGLKEGYRKMLAAFFSLCDIDNAENRASNALKVEETLADFSWSNVENRDIIKQYNPMSSAEFESAYPGFDFKAFTDAIGIPAQEKIIVSQPSFFKGMNGYFAAEQLDVLKDYVAASMIVRTRDYLSDDFYAAGFDFFSRQMSGITDQKPRWKRAMSVPNFTLGEAVGQMYVAEYFPESYKQKVLDIVHNLQKSLGEHIDALEWMSDDTKAYAREKLAAFTIKIGYPDKWKDYSTLDVNPQMSYLDNVLAAGAWSRAEQLSKLGKAPDRAEWFMSPQTVNAYYNPTTNEICFPAAILQPPFFNADADDAVNYGAIGVVIGHEMTHGFDDQGRLFDKKGNMNDWWTAEDAEAFKARTAILEKQYSSIEVLPGLFANGAFSLGENIADQGGVNVAFTAMQNSWNGTHPADIDGFTAEQRFFLGFAHVWAGNITDEEKARRTSMDEHSLSVNRVNATLKNIAPFYEAFGIKEGDAMWMPEEERVLIW